MELPKEALRLAGGVPFLLVTDRSSEYSR